jgi:cytochrome P450
LTQPAEGIGDVLRHLLEPSAVAGHEAAANALAMAAEDRDHAGEPLRWGQSLIVGLGAANRDPERFDEPDRLRELLVVVPRVLRRLPGLTLAETPTGQPTLDFRGPTSLRVTWR